MAIKGEKLGGQAGIGDPAVDEEKSGEEVPIKNAS